MAEEEFDCLMRMHRAWIKIVTEKRRILKEEIDALLVQKAELQAEVNG